MDITESSSMTLTTLTTPLIRGFAESPFGRLRLVASDQGLVGLYFPEHRRARQHDARDEEHHPVLDSARRELAEYFAAARARFDTPLAPAPLRAGTEFQHAVWDALRAIPFGETRTYADIARSIGRPSAVRAVGAANALNPISILVPCHRVIGGSGSLTGYAGGIETKRWLLAHEGSPHGSAGAPSEPRERARAERARTEPTSSRR
jgi:methylated-DNA-[protein]-cysteine S-methyltransferase